MELQDFVKEDKVYVSASVFPVQLTVNSAGRSPVRFMLLKHPTEDEWWAAAWATSYGSVEQVLFGKVTEALKVHVSGIELMVDPGDGFSTHVSAVPSSGGCCGNRLKSWNPFGPGVQLLYMPYNSITKS